MSDTERRNQDSLWSGWNRTWLPRAAYLTVVVVAVFYGTTWVFRNTAGFLVTLVLSVFAAFAMLPAVEALSKRGWRRGLATGVVMLGTAAFSLVFLYALLNVAIGEVIKLVGRAPDYVESVVDWANRTFNTEFSSDTIIEQLTTDQERLQQLSTNAASGVLGLASTAVGLLFQALTIGLFVFYILADLPRLRAAVLRRIPPTQQLHADTVIGITIEKVGGYVYSRSVLAVFSAIVHFVAFSLIGVPYAVALAMWVGIVSQFVPTVGTYLAGAFPLIIALVEDPVDAIWVLATILVYQQIENYVLAPRITANTMDLHPAVAFGSAIVGASLLGGVGAILALPVAATLTALVQTYGDHYDVIASGTIESPEEYEARMHEYAQQKAARRRLRAERWREFAGLDSAEEGRGGAAKS
ncbi:MAG: AI-2E family transporter [Acidimicrobiia bacterium]|nr:AI-2E family transporter [Acidimicrobiia bacterium]